MAQHAGDHGARTGDDDPTAACGRRPAGLEERSGSRAVGERDPTQVDLVATQARTVDQLEPLGEEVRRREVELAGDHEARQPGTGDDLEDQVEGRAGDDLLRNHRDRLSSCAR